jgi:hypothetical protein
MEEILAMARVLVLYLSTHGTASLFIRVSHGITDVGLAYMRFALNSRWTVTYNPLCVMGTARPTLLIVS